MSYLGLSPQISLQNYLTIDDISGSFDGLETSFALQVGGAAPVPGPKQSNQLLISVNGVIQEPDDTGTTGFKLSGGNIVFSSAPTGGHSFFGVVLAGANYISSGGSFAAGTAAAPSLTFSGDTDTGIYSPGANQLSIATGGTQRIAVKNTGEIRYVTAFTVSTLPTGEVGDIARVTDANSPSVGSTVTGGGAANALCWYNGSNWTVIGV